jgi:peptidoglycan hydrolase CwlO-like protein
MKAQTNKMDKELKNLNSLNTSLAEFVSVLFNNEEKLKSKISSQRARISYQNNRIKSFKEALYQTTQLIQNEPELINHATELKNKFCSQSVVQVKMDSEI